MLLYSLQCPLFTLGEVMIKGMHGNPYDPSFQPVFGGKLQAGEPLKGTDLCAAPGGWYPCLGLEGHVLSSSEANGNGVTIIRFLNEEPSQSPGPFIPQ